MSIGMSPEEFWHGNPKLAIAYREAESIRRDNRYNAEWRSGVYMYEALLAASPAFREFGKGIDHKYPQTPLFASTIQTKTDRANKAAMEKNRHAFEAMVERFNTRLQEAHNREIKGD